jgi:hypothetical protein
MKAGSKIAAYVALMTVTLMITMGCMPAGADFVTKFDATGTDEISITFPEDGGSSAEATITMPSISVARNSILKISSDSVDEEKFTDYRKDEDPAMKYNGNYYHDFPPIGSEYDGSEMTVSKNGAQLRKYSGHYDPKFGDWNFVDNASTSANYLADDGFYSIITAGNDQSESVNYPTSGWDCQGCSTDAKKGGTKSKTYFMNGRLFKSVTARADGYTYPYSYYSVKGTVKGWNVNTQKWDTLVNEYDCGYGTVTDRVFYTHTWTTPIYSMMQVKASTSYAWGSYYAGFEFQSVNQGFKDSSTFTSSGADIRVDGSFNKDWTGWPTGWTIYNATLIPDERLLTGSITYYMSNQNGTPGSWEQVTGNVTHTFSNPGYILRWRADFATGSNTLAPEIHEVDIVVNRLFSTSQVITAGKFNTKRPITEIKPVWNETVPEGTDVIVSVSNDNGTTWSEVANGATKELPWTTEEDLDKTELKWKAELKSDGRYTPILRNITIHYLQSMYPSNIVVRSGTLTTPLWTHDGFFFESEGVKDIDGNDFVIDLNYILPHLDQGDMTIPLNVSSDTAGVIRFSSINVEYGEPPVLSTEIPTQTIDEDSGIHNKIIDLEKYFSDDYDDGKLSFEIPFQEDAGKVRAWIEDKKYLSIETVKPNWYGQVRFVVRAMDLVGLKTQSNTFTVEVSNVNDRPTLMQPPNVSIIVNELYEYQLVVDDPDLDTFTFSMSPPILSVDPATGKISHTSSKDQIGTYNDVTVTVTDNGGLSDSKKMNIEINNKNTGPKLNAIGPQFPVVNQKFELTVSAEDPDLEYNDVLTYSLVFDELAQPEGMVIDPVSGKIAWTPNKAGTYWATVVVADKTGADSREFVTFTVERVNTPPHDVYIQSPGDGEKSNTTTSVSFIGMAKDDDPNDRLLYTWYMDGNQFGVGQNFKTVISETGQHKIKMVVSDGKPGHEIETEVTITIEKADEKKITIDDAEKVEKTIVPGMSNSMFMLVLLFIVVVVVIIIATVYGQGGDTRKKLRELEAEMRGEIQPPVKAQPPMEQTPREPPSQP